MRLVQHLDLTPTAGPANPASAAVDQFLESLRTSTQMPLVGGSG